VRILDVHEQPRLELQNLELFPSLLKNLQNLSIISHRGGARLWESILTPENLPSLKRLAFYEITAFAPANSDPPQQSQFSSDIVLTHISAELTPRDWTSGTEEYLVSETVLRKASRLFPQLDFLVSRDYPFLRQYPHLQHLSIISRNTLLTDGTKYALVYDAHSFECNDSFFNQLKHIVQLDGDDLILEYLVLQPLADNRYRKARREERMKHLEITVEKGVKVHYDADDDSQFIPQSFINFLARKAQKEKEVLEES
jgi:hypothetical protein